MERRTSGGSINTFVFGILVGVAITLLLTTKKGRKLLKILTEEGAEKITKWEEMLQAAQEEAVEEDFAAEEEMVEATGEAVEYVEPEERQVEDRPSEEKQEDEKQPEEIVPQKTFEKIEPVVVPEVKKEPEPKKAANHPQEKSEKEEPKEDKPKTSRRFFRGVRKK